MSARRFTEYYTLCHIIIIIIIIGEILLMNQLEFKHYNNLLEKWRAAALLI